MSRRAYVPYKRAKISGACTSTVVEAEFFSRRLCFLFRSIDNLRKMWRHSTAVLNLDRTWDRKGTEQLWKCRLWCYSMYIFSLKLIPLVSKKFSFASRWLTAGTYSRQNSSPNSIREKSAKVCSHRSHEFYTRSLVLYAKMMKYTLMSPFLKETRSSELVAKLSAE